jgi:hypothetical protein
MGLICIPGSGLGLPGVNLIIYKDDLRMMASKQGAAREGGMKQKRNNSLDLQGGSDKLPCSMIWRKA